MAVDLIFSISQELRNGELFFVVEVQEKGRARILYFPVLKELSRSFPELASLLMQEHCKNSGISPSSPQLETLSCNKIRIRASKSLDVLQKLILSKQFQWKGRSLFFNPLSKSKLCFEAELKQEDLCLEGFLEMGGAKHPIASADFLFLGTPVWGIVDQMVFVLPGETRASWMDFVYPAPRRLEGKQKQRFLEDFQEDPPEGFPEIVWKGQVPAPEVEGASPLPVFPCLVLRDLRGAFADLKMEYGERQVDFEDPRFFPGRDPAAEKAWEQDFLETDFVRKMMGTSHYYCPMDKVVSSLSFLLEIGWKIFDAKGRRVMRASGSALSLQTASQGLALKGALSYGDHQVDVKDVVGSFSRRERFVEISLHAVGLLDESQPYEGLQELAESDLLIEGSVLPPKGWGLLDSLKQSSQWIVEPGAKRLLERLESLQEVPLEEKSLPHFQGILRPYQKTGVDWLFFLHSNQLSGLLADEMGLGKTVQVLAFLSAFSSPLPLLIVVPTSLVFNWNKEWHQFIKGKELYVHEGSKRSMDLEFLQRQSAILTSYALLRADSLLFQKLSFSCIVLDEAQWIKNPESQLARVLYSLRSEMNLCLTGTPIENKADDLWSLFHFLEPELLGERKKFLGDLQAAESDGRYTKRIRKLLRPFILRRLKDEVAGDLPEKMEQTVWVEMKESQRSIYEEWLSKTRTGLLKKVSLEGASAYRMEIFEAILRLRQICCHPLLVTGEFPDEAESAKLERMMEDLEEVVAEGRKVLIYSQFTQMLQLIRKQIEKRGYKYAYLDGDTKNREEPVSCFQTDPSISVFLISLKAGGVGLNLTAADYVFLFDPWWNEAVERQAIDRAHRLGRKGAVIARRYVVAESVEEKMMKLKAYKTSLASGLLDVEQEGPLIDLEAMLSLLRE